MVRPASAAAPTPFGQTGVDVATGDQALAQTATVSAASTPGTGQAELILVPTATPQPSAPAAPVAVILLPTPTPTPPAPEASATAQVLNEGGVNARLTPNTTSPVILVLAQGTRVVVSGRSLDGAWLQVRLEDDTPAWVSTQYMELDGSLEELAIVPAATE